ncbi:amino acid ABC transporter permease [Brevibacillus nitrificans]|uniref:Amino acid ABC transporter permease n=1 Tax=Brevibacillus nitrificans TaxID=651560 RepID=A0A3M8D6S7_9BACL|nr:amino acid ABC transporter permease [Brevibacillus nitrificans]MED1793375.1 amino acid ABC transporter permease [Brevibacillus nitrificans]RNB83780.1 amino acid ABC transporter permease [Brevibacillus nitrificans]
MTTILEYWPLFVKGTLVTLELTFFSLIVSLMIGLFTAFARISRNAMLQKLASVYISIIRGTPLLVQLMYIYFIFPEFGLDLSPFWAALIGLSLYEGAYLAEIYRAGIKSIGAGQLEAAYAIGMNYSTAMRRIILPQAIKNVLPAIGNTAILLLKNSSLAGVITVNELMHTGENIAVSTFRNVEIFTLIAVIYWLLHYPLARFVSYLEKRMSNDSSKRN